MSKLTGWMVVTSLYSGGFKGDKTVYEHKDAAEFAHDRAKRNLGEWEETKLEEVQYTMLNETKCDVGGRVCCIDRTDRRSMVRGAALTKLNAEEKDALDLGNKLVPEPLPSLGAIDAGQVEREFVDWWLKNVTTVVNRAVVESGRGTDEKNANGFYARWIARIAWHQARGTMP